MMDYERWISININSQRLKQRPSQFYSHKAIWRFFYSLYICIPKFWPIYWNIRSDVYCTLNQNFNKSWQWFYTDMVCLLSFLFFFKSFSQALLEFLGHLYYALLLDYINCKSYNFHLLFWNWISTKFIRIFVIIWHKLRIYENMRNLLV